MDCGWSPSRVRQPLERHSQQEGNAGRLCCTHWEIKPRIQLGPAEFDIHTDGQIDGRSGGAEGPLDLTAIESQRSAKCGGPGNLVSRAAEDLGESIAELQAGFAEYALGLAANSERRIARRSVRLGQSELQIA